MATPATRCTIFYSPADVSLHGELLLSLAFDFYPFYLSESRHGWICDAIETQNLKFLRCVMDKDQRNRYFKVAAGFRHNLKIFKYFIHELGCDLTGDIFAATAKTGDLDNIKYLHQHQCTWLEDTFSAAAKHGSLTNMQWFHQNKCPWNEFIVDVAVEHCDLATLKALVEELQCPWNQKRTLQRAVDAKRDLDVIEWLHEKECPCDEETFSQAATHGDLEILQWLHEKKCPWNERTFEAAAKHGSLVNLQWLHEKKCPWDETTFAAAAKHGSLDNLQWLYKKKCPWDGRTFYSAAEHGSLVNLQWLHAKKCPWNEVTFALAAAHGSLINMEWLRKNKCPWDNEETISHALAYGSPLENLKWLKDVLGCNFNDCTLSIPKGSIKIAEWFKEIGCELNDTFYLTEAAMNGSTELLQWLKDNGSLDDDVVDDICEEAAEIKSMETISWLYKNTGLTDTGIAGIAAQGSLDILKLIKSYGGSEIFESTNILQGAILSGSFDIVNWLFDNGCVDVHHDLYSAAAEVHSLDIMKWLKTKGCFPCEPFTLAVAAQTGSLEIMKWLKDNGCPVTHPIALQFVHRRGIEENIKWLTEHRNRI